MKLPIINAHCHQVYDSQEWSILNIHDTLSFNSSQLCSVGIHPWHAQEAFDHDRVDDFYRLIQNTNVRAIGECGLDKVCSTPYELQLKVFSMQILWAIEWKKPLIIHCVRSQQEVIKELKGFTGGYVFHGFNRNLEMAHSIVNQGGYLSLDEVFLRTQQGRIVAKHIPLDRLFLETDNEPISVRGAYICLSELLGIDLEEIALQLHENALEIGLIET
jgi:TatD DNase family protein